MSLASPLKGCTAHMSKIERKKAISFTFRAAAKKNPLAKEVKGT
jgi:hypothetical protein